MKRKHPDDVDNVDNEFLAMASAASRAITSSQNKKTKFNQIMINTNVMHAFGPLFPQMSTTQTEREQLEAQAHQEDLEEYAIYGQSEEMVRTDRLIRDLDVMMAAIRDDDAHYPSMKRSSSSGSGSNKSKTPQCKLYTQCSSALCGPNQEKLRSIKREIESTDRYICNKYDFAERIVRTKCQEEVVRATQALIAKYDDKRKREERLFKHSFARYRHRISKAKKQQQQQKELEQQKEQQTGQSEQKTATDETTTTTMTTATPEQSKTESQLDMQQQQQANEAMHEDELETLFGTEKYPRYKLISSSAPQQQSEKSEAAVTATPSFLSYPSFNDEQMQEKWCKIKDLAKTDMADDVNCMVCDRDDGNASDVSDTSTSTSTTQSHHTLSTQQHNRLEIRDILSMFPVCDVLYRSDKNTITVNYVRPGGDSWTETLKVGSMIACQYSKQSVMRGPIVTIASTGIWCQLRKNLKQCAKFEEIEDHMLHEIKLQSIEDGTAKIKLLE